MSDFLDGSVRSYVQQAASDAPTPGGGSVAALSAALGNAMASMAGQFTVGKKKFAAVDAEVREILSTLAPLREELLQRMQQDSVAFAAIGAAYGLPRGSAEEKDARGVAIQKALTGAMEVPLAVMHACVQCLEPLPRLAEIGNPNLVSDTGVAAILLEAATRAAHLNVMINVVSLRDKQRARQVAAEADALLQRARTDQEQTIRLVRSTIHDT